MITTLALIAVLGLEPGGVSTKFMASGAVMKAGGYRPLRAEMDGTADLVKKAPEDLKMPKYGTITFEPRLTKAKGDKEPKKADAPHKGWVFILDEHEDEPAKLFIDTNADGDLTNDPKTTWTANKAGGLTMYTGEGQIDLGGGNVGTLGLYRFDPTDERRAQLEKYPDVLPGLRV